jgi:RNA polymerase sigma factor (sigma-70 family)
MKEVSISDENLIQLYTLGNVHALSVLYNRHKRKVTSYLYFKLKDKELAEDIFQESFLKVVQQIDKQKYINQGKFYNFLIRISRNACIDYLRAKKNKPNILNIDDINQNNIVEIIEKDEHQEQKRRYLIDEIVALVDELPSDEREIIILKHYANLTFKEIAELTDININTALGKMRTALKRLKILAERNGLKI